MYNLTKFFEIEFGLTIAWIENDRHLEFKIEDKDHESKCATYIFGH